MPLIDLPLPELQRYQPPLTREPDYQAFWDENRRLSAAQPLNAEVTPVAHPAAAARVHKIFYDGFGGGRIC
ncbi:MAG: acetylxylan esterase, partial [Bacteroidota bacterium]